MILALARHAHTSIADVEEMPVDDFAAYFDELLGMLEDERRGAAKRER